MVSLVVAPVGGRGSGPIAGATERIATGTEKETSVDGDERVAIDDLGRQGRCLLEVPIRKCKVWSRDRIYCT